MATTAKTMTERELLTAIVEGKEITAEMVNKAQAMLTALDKKNSKRKESGTKTQKENAEIKAQILEMMDVGNCYTAKEIADVMGFSTQKASALLGQLVTAGELEKSEVKAKSGKVIGYSLITAKTAETAEELES
jgi:Fic family protein